MRTTHAIFLVAGLCVGQNRPNRPSVEPRRESRLSTTEIARRVAPAVVVVAGVTDNGDVIGSGFLVGQGIVVTNVHVLRDVRTAKIELANGTRMDVRDVLAFDEPRDLAILQVTTTSDLAPLSMGDSDNLAVGEPVVVVGSPRGLGGTVTAGILSAVRDSGEGYKLLQTDAAVNAGNSGGPLVNSSGEAIGVVSFKLRSSEGLNFAVPVKYVRELLNAKRSPMSLQEMQQKLGKTSQFQERTPNRHKTRLEQTLARLRRDVSMGAVRYQLGSENGSWVTERAVPINLDSCAAIFARIYQIDNKVLTDRYSLSLSSINDVWVRRSLNSEKIAAGDRWGVYVYVGTEPDGVTVESTDDIRPKHKDTFRLVFKENEIAEQVKTELLAATTLCRAEQASEGPSLNETLSWLKEKMPLASNQYTLENPEMLGMAKRMGPTTDVSHRTTPVAFDSCAVKYDHVEERRWSKYPNEAQSLTVRSTVPLGSVVDVRIRQDSIALSIPVFSSKMVPAWVVSLRAESGTILRDSYETGTQTRKSEAEDVAFLTFWDKSIAERVADAFRHAARLCAGKEPF